MPRPLNRANIPKLRIMAAERRKRPTQKINSILRRKKRAYERDRVAPELHSHELGFVTKKGERGVRYSVREATPTSVYFTTQERNARRQIHTHPWIVAGKSIQRPVLGINDLVTFISSESKAAYVAVTSRTRDKVAGYGVVTRKRKSTPKKLLNGSLESALRNPMYWEGELKKLTRLRAETFLGERTKALNLVFTRGKNLSKQLAKIQANVTTETQRHAHFQAGLKYRYNSGIISELEYAQQAARMEEEFTAKLKELEGERNATIGAIRSLVEKNSPLIDYYKNYARVAESGLMELFFPNGALPRKLEHHSFQTIKPAQGSIAYSTLGSSDVERIKKILAGLGLNFRLVPEKGFTLRNGEFVEVKKTK